MTITPPPLDAGSTAEIVEMAGHGGRLATIFSAFALLFSGFSFYESNLKQADLEVYVPPVIHYARDGGGDVELFVIPITIVNDGAKTGTVLSMELEVTNPKADATPKSKRYYSAFFGEHPKNPDATNRTFAPLSIAGRATFSDSVRFYATGNPLPKLVGEAGEYTFKLKLNMAVPQSPNFLDQMTRGEPAALEFSMTLPWMSDQQLGFRRSTISMHQKDWKPTSTTAK